MNLETLKKLYPSDNFELVNPDHSCGAPIGKDDTCLAPAAYVGLFEHMTTGTCEKHAPEFCRLIPMMESIYGKFIRMETWEN